VESFTAVCGLDGNASSAKWFRVFPLNATARKMTTADDACSLSFQSGQQKEDTNIKVGSNLSVPKSSPKKESKKFTAVKEPPKVTKVLEEDKLTMNSHFARGLLLSFDTLPPQSSPTPAPVPPATASPLPDANVISTPAPIPDVTVRETPAPPSAAPQATPSPGPQTTPTPVPITDTPLLRNSKKRGKKQKVTVLAPPGPGKEGKRNKKRATVIAEPMSEPLQVSNIRGKSKKTKVKIVV
jgi:hypothetical protein